MQPPGPIVTDKTLTRDEIAVWWMATDTVGCEHLHRWLEMLDEEERERSVRFHFEIDRRDFIAAHTLLRSILSSYMNSPADQWRFTRDPHGKPRIQSPVGSEEIPFNLSHTHGLVAAAVATHGAIGVDAERVDPMKADFEIAEEYFAPSEVRILRGLPAAERTTCFFRLWTLKEAYIKALGTGLGTPLNSFAFALQPIRVEFDAGIPGRAADWQFAILPTTDQHVLSLAVGRTAGDAVRISSRAVVPQDL
jgi:4'-phosphopantetheinyl transferase